MTIKIDSFGNIVLRGESAKIGRDIQNADGFRVHIGECQYGEFPELEEHPKTGKDGKDLTTFSLTQDGKDLLTLVKQGFYDVLLGGSQDGEDGENEQPEQKALTTAEWARRAKQEKKERAAKMARLVSQGVSAPCLYGLGWSKQLSITDLLDSPLWIDGMAFVTDEE